MGPGCEGIPMSTQLRLKRLYVSARYAPFVGGTASHVREVASRMVVRGHDVTVLTSDPTDDHLPRGQSDGITIRRVGAWPNGRNYYLAPGIYRQIGRGDWNVVHLQGYHTLVAPLIIDGGIAAADSLRYLVSEWWPLVRAPHPLS